MLCSKGIRGCGHEFRIAMFQMNFAFKQAAVYNTRNSPYNVPAYPYVWDVPSPKNIRLDMGPDAMGRKIVAMFFHEQEPLRIGTLVHLSLWVVINPDVKDWSALPVEDNWPYIDDINHYKGTFMGVRGTLFPQVTNVPPSS